MHIGFSNGERKITLTQTERKQIAAVRCVIEEICHQRRSDCSAFLAKYDELTNGAGEGEAKTSKAKDECKGDTECKSQKCNAPDSMAPEAIPA